MRITFKQYAQTLYEITDGKSVADFARYIYRKRKLKIAGKVIEQFAAIYNEKKGIVEADAVTAEKLSAGAEKKVKEYIEKKYGAKEVVLKNTVDEKIKGGIVLKVGDEVVDGSLEGRLEELRKILT